MTGFPLRRPFGEAARGYCIVTVTSAGNSSYCYVKDQSGNSYYAYGQFAVIAGSVLTLTVVGSASNATKTITVDGETVVSAKGTSASTYQVTVTDDIGIAMSCVTSTSSGPRLYSEIEVTNGAVKRFRVEVEDTTEYNKMNSYITYAGETYSCAASGSPDSVFYGIEGTKIYCYAYAEDSYSYISVNNATADKSDYGGPATYYYTLTKDCKIEFSGLGKIDITEL